MCFQKKRFESRESLFSHNIIFIFGKIQQIHELFGAEYIEKKFVEKKCLTESKGASNGSE